MYPKTKVGDQSDYLEWSGEQMERVCIDRRAKLCTSLHGSEAGISLNADRSSKTRQHPEAARGEIINPSKIRGERRDDKNQEAKR